MTVADQAGDYQISNVPSEIHRDPVWVSRRPNGQRSTWSPQHTSPLCRPVAGSPTGAVQEPQTSRSRCADGRTTRRDRQSVVEIQVLRLPASGLFATMLGSADCRGGPGGLFGLSLPPE